VRYRFCECRGREKGKGDGNAICEEKIGVRGTPSVVEL